MTLRVPSLRLYASSLIIALLLGAIAYFLLSAQAFAHASHFLLAGVLLGHLVGVVCAAGTPVQRSVATDDSDSKASLYVGNLAYKASSDDLRELFARYGKVHSVRIMKDHRTNKPRGYAFVEMDDHGAEAAIAGLHNQDYLGRALIVNSARQRPEE